MVNVMGKTLSCFQHSSANQGKNQLELVLCLMVKKVTVAAHLS